MAIHNNLLILRLEGVLQSWGEDSKWDYRNTASMPTKSGIVGLLGCALGFERNNEEIVDLAHSIRIATRADRAGTRFVDFHTVTGNPLLNALGKSKSGGNTIITPRAYLQDACFTVFIETTEDWHKRICEALENPKWCIYLGRKSCVPSRPVLECVDPEFDSIADAVRNYPCAKRHDREMVIEWEASESSTISYMRPDINDYGERQFAMRRVWMGTQKGADNVSG